MDGQLRIYVTDAVAAVLANFESPATSREADLFDGQAPFTYHPDIWRISFSNDYLSPR